MSPNWDALYEIAYGQSGYFSVEQAKGCGFSSQLTSKHLQSGFFLRPLRGIYRFTRYPPAESEDLVALWLWSEQLAVFSHETALVQHELDDEILPSRIYMTVPPASARRTPPMGTVARVASLERSDWLWTGPVPFTTPARTVNDLAASQANPELVSRAITRGIRMKLFDFDQVAFAGSYVFEALHVKEAEPNRRA